MKRIKGTTLALFGLFFGLLLGCGVVGIKYYLVQEIVDSLDSEVEASCDCKLVFDSFSLSFLRLKGRATNVRLVENGVPRLWFDEITTDVDISEIREKRVYLENLTLSGGTADGVGPDSVMFRFIDQITKPLPPEQQDPDRWRAILNTLRVENTLLREPLGESEMLFLNTSMDLKREGEEYLLKPRVGDLRYRLFAPGSKNVDSELLLGSLSAAVKIEDTRVLFDQVEVGRNSSRASIRMAVDTDHGDQCRGEAAFELTPDYIGLPDWLLGTFEAQTAVAGTLGSPTFQGPLRAKPDAPLTLAFPNAKPLALESFGADLSVDVNHGDPVVTLSNIIGSAAGSSLKGTAPLTFSDEGLRAGFSVELPEFNFGPFDLTKASARVEISPEGDETVTKLAVRAQDLLLQGTSLGPSTLSITIKGDSLDVAADISNSRQGSLKWRGAIDMSGSEPLLSKGDLTLTNYRYLSTKPSEGDALSPVAVTADLSLRGPLDLAKLKMEGETSVSFPSTPQGMTLNGKSVLKDGVLAVSLPGSAYKGNATLRVDLAGSSGGRLNVALPGVPLSVMVQGGDCGSINASLDYSFQLANPLEGTGSIEAEDIKVGCAPYVLSLPQRSNLPIVGGALKLNQLKLSGNESTMTLNGEVGIAKGFNLSLDGGLYLSSLLPLMPALDNLRGLLVTKVSLKGPLNDPSFHGSAELSGGEFGIHEPDVEAHKVAGNFTLNGKGISFEKLTGSVNSGSFEMSGTVLPANPENSSLTARLNQVTIEPIPDASITVSGDFKLGTGPQQRQTLSGDLAINFAEVKKEFNLNKIIVNAISGYFLPSRIKQQASSSSRPMDLDLDVRIHAPRNIFVLTPFFSAELNADIRATRSISEPALDGKMEILSGWVGLKGNRFDITSGEIAFKPGNLTPQLSISSEGNVRTPTGDTILVILEAEGPLTSPRIILSSDRALSQDEILVLLTSSRSLTGRNMANRFSGPMREDDRFFFSKSSFGSIGSFFSSLSKIDVLSFEPAYNPWTGSIEPSVVTKKNLSSRLDLVGESLMGTVQSSRAGVVYNLSPTLSINGFVQNISNQRNNIVSSDLTYTILAEQSTFIDFEINGIDEFSEDNILSAARLSVGSRVKNTEESLVSVTRDIVRYMNMQGHLAATADVQCTEGEPYCRKLKIDIYEGPPFTIAEIAVDGDGLEPRFEKELRSEVELGDPATASTANNLERDLVLSLRREGYITARVSPSYEAIPGTSTAKLIVTTDIQEPISFVFKGNTVFSDSDFLDSIDLFTRRRPFGNNTIKLLLQNIEQMYQQRGFLFVQVSYTEDRTNSERLIYHITINEEARTKVRHLQFNGRTGFSMERIRALMDELGYSEQKELLTPEYAVPSDLDTLRDILTVVFQQEGFTDVSVSYAIEPAKDSDTLDITYTVREGEPHRVRAITTHDLPAGVTAPPLPATPASYPKVNQYIEQLVASLKDEGYIFPSVWSDATADDSSIEISIDPGPLATIGSISYEGLSELSLETAKSFTKMHVGQPYRLEAVNATKRALLRSGLFSRVEVVAADGEVNSPNEAIIIRVVERPLNTLEVGAGANSEFGLHLFGEATDKSLFQDGRSLSFRLDTYLDQLHFSGNNADNISQGFASLRYLDPEFMGSNYVLTEEARYQRQTLSTYEFDLDRFLIASYIFRQFHHGISLSAGHSLALDDLFNVNPDAIIGPLDDGHVRLSYLSGVLKYDNRDDPLLPRSGYTMTLEPKLSMVGIASEANFGTIVGTVTGIVPLKPLGERFSLGLVASGGLSQPWGSTTEIPITQRFYLGGRTTVRGYDQNSLGPEGENGAIIGGDTLLLAKGQFQYLLFDSFSTHLFLDAGNVWLRHVDFDLSATKQGSGAGFQYLSPIGPIGLDVGTPLNPNSGDPRFLVTFSVGSVF